MSNDFVEEMNERIRAQRTQRQRDQGAYGELFNEVARILYQHDFMSLATIGCPVDEYDPETRTIVPRLHEAASPDELATIIEEEFVRWFGAQPSGSQEWFAKVARDVWSAWERYAAQ